MKSITENFNLSLLEIFSVLLPGGAAILLFQQKPGATEIVYRPFPEIESEWLLAAIFISASYFTGYVLFYFGSLLDDLLYEYVRILLYKPRKTDVIKLQLARQIEGNRNLKADTEEYKDKLLSSLLSVLAKEIKSKSVEESQSHVKSLLPPDKVTSETFENDACQMLLDKLNSGKDDDDLKLAKWFIIDGKITLGFFKRVALLFKHWRSLCPLYSKSTAWPDKIIHDLLEGKTQLFKDALKIKTLETGQEGSDSINLYKWAVGKLLITQPDMHAVVERHQTASKFFRSMVVVSILSIFLICLCKLKISIWSSVVVFVVSLLIYLQQRYKGVRTAYEYIIVTSSLKVKI